MCCVPSPASQSKLPPTTFEGPRHVKCSGDGGKPENAIAFCDEGMPGQFKTAFNVDLEAYNVTADDWENIICKKLRDTWSCSKQSTVAAIEELSKDYFVAKGLNATYAEYSLGVKGMTVYTREEWDKLP